MTDLVSSVAKRVAAAIKNTIPHPRLGLVSAVDPVNHAVKVKLQPEDLETGWLPYVVGSRSGALRCGSPPSIGQHVKVTPIEGDAEHLVVSADIHDDVVQAPISPVTGKPAQPGELLVRAAYGAPPTTTEGRSAGEPDANGAWYHLTAGTFYAGAGNARMAITDGSITLTVGAASFTFTEAALAVLGANITTDETVTGQTDVKTSSISLNEHVHGGVKSGPDTTSAPE
ncbi:baseplate assembly protein [Acetobacter aceti]|uniref:Baseplate assembly protein n=1 Tax=Acetobacter aceti TaxID=435 RepID=A0A6S6PSG8_ACEAC|nr:phage baseplate assembly protein V [Acetobacter aceti]BCI68064.1 baseplate assembly protein [Acetobacter aceti]